MIPRLAPASFLLAALVLLAAIAPARAAPALFVARAQGTTIYLLGSFHALPPGTAWETPAIDGAFDSASHVWFEAVLDDLPNNFAATMLARGMDPAHPLSTRLDPPDAERLRQRVATLPPPYVLPLIDGMRPWLAALIIGVADFQKSGFQEALGVDRVLQARAKAHGIPMSALEDPASTIRSIATLPDSTGLAMLRETLKTKSPEKLEKSFFFAWRDGDIDRLAQLLGTAADPSTSGLQGALLANRNAAWALRLAALKSTRATLFVTVGAGHLAGPGNLRTLLTEAGFTVTRVPTDPQPGTGR